MGYSVLGVHRATQPPPEQVKQRLAVRISPEPIVTYEQYDSRHPYYHVRNLYASNSIDVVVQFCEAGPSGSMWDSEEATAALGRYEYASLWEIEPPTERQRQMHDLVVRVSKTESDEEAAILMAELNALGQQEEDEQATATEESSARTPQEAPSTLAEWAAQYAAANGSTVEEVTRAALEAYARQHGYARQPPHDGQP
jgi:hypothetical protein